MSTDENTRRRFPLHGWLGAHLILIFWSINWFGVGLRTYWAFFPLWLGYCLAMDGLVFKRTGTSLLTRGPRRYVGMFIVSAPMWWIFELFNLRTRNWIYFGAESFSLLSYIFWTTLSFTTVIPAVFASAELFASFEFVKKIRRGLVIRKNKVTTVSFFLAGWIMLALMLAWPMIFFPFMWFSVYFILEPLNIWLGNRSLPDWTESGDWRPVVSLWLGVLLTAIFWEMWNYYSYPKWLYQVAWGNWLHVFEMPLLGYGGYLPFALELFALYHLVMGLLGDKQTDYIKLDFSASR